MEEILARCALLTRPRAGGIEQEAIVWLDELRGYTAAQIRTAFELYRKRGGKFFPTSADIFEILQELLPMPQSLPNPDKERFERLCRMTILSIDDADFYEKYAEINGKVITTAKAQEIEGARLKHALETLTEEEKKKRIDSIMSKFAEARKMINQYEA